jgi:hypothetical protein
MSYPCKNSAGAFVFTPTLNQFSNPTLSHNSVPAGSASSDCSRMLRETSTRVAGARPTTVTTLTGGTITTALSATKCIDTANLNFGTQVSTAQGQIVKPCT